MKLFTREIILVSQILGSASIFQHNQISQSNNISTSIFIKMIPEQKVVSIKTRLK